MRIRMLLAVVMAAAIVSPLPALAQAKPKAQKASICRSLEKCISNGMSGANQYGQKYDRATATSWCRANNNGCPR